MSSGDKGIVKIQPMKRKDVFPVLAMLNKTGWRGTLTQRDFHDYGLGGRRPSLSFVAEVDGQVVGLLLGRLAFLGVPLTEMGVIETIAVDPDYQRRYIGSKLVNAVLDRCFAEGIGTVRVYVTQRDWELKTFVENMSFRPSGSILYTRNIEV